MVPKYRAETGLVRARVPRPGWAGRLPVGSWSIPPPRALNVVRPERPASFPQFAVHPERLGLADSGDGGNMSVAFAAPRQRGKGEITPAAIQKVKPRGVGDARPCPRLGGTRGPGRESAGLGAEAGLLGGGWVWEPEPRAAPEWVAEGGEPVLSRSPARVWAPSYRHKSPSNWRLISLGMGRCSRGGARAPGGGGRARKGCFPRPAPPARRSGVTLASPRPARRGGSVQTSPRVAGGPRGSRSVAVSPRRAANSGRVGELSPEFGGRAREP